MTYSESAKGQTISFERAVQEYVNHGVTHAETELVADLGKRKKYNATTVLSALGY